jgi:ribosomal protein L31
MKEKIIAKCKNCGKEFVKFSTTKRDENGFYHILVNFCSESCRIKYHTSICRNCGKSFVRIVHNKEKPMFCASCIANGRAETNHFRLNPVPFRRYAWQIRVDVWKKKSIEALE